MKIFMYVAITLIIILLLILKIFNLVDEKRVLECKLKNKEKKYNTLLTNFVVQKNALECANIQNSNAKH